MENRLLYNLLMEYGCPDGKIIQEHQVSECNILIRKLRDQLVLMGNILYEDLEKNVYVAAVKTGFFHMGTAVVAMQLRGQTLCMAGYAREGLIKQHLLEKAFNRIEDSVHDKDTLYKRRKAPRFLTLVILVVLLIAGVFSGREVQKTVAATKTYNEAVISYNQQAEKYNTAAARTSLDNINGLPSALDLLTEESEAFWDNMKVVLGANSREKIIADTETITELTEQIKMATEIVRQITAPPQDWVIERLSDVPGITGSQAVSEKLDPDDLLGKNGSYQACVYFTVSGIDPAKIPGESIVEKGTDAGGAIEIYATLPDAETRCEYLSGFDDTVLYSGSYAIVGTVVIRTSYKLTNEQQIELTNAITQAFTSLQA